MTTSFTFNPSDPSDEYRRTDGQDSQHQSSAGTEAPNCRAMVDSRASERESSFAAPSRLGGSRYAPRESVDRRASPPAAVVEVGRSFPTRISEVESDADRLGRNLRKLRNWYDQERQVRLALEASVQRYRLHQSDDRSTFACSQLKNKRSSSHL
uniref:RxLR effector candidate protein n=1 Tax=Hyaloperonospora arabidopsidis (strain Emoy2) TaxID=559515 RepID=M4BQA6_HYAAE